MSKQKRTWDVILAVVMVLLCLLWIYPIVLILLNSLKTEGSFTTSTVFRLPTAETFAGLRNYVYGVTKMDFLSSMGYSLLITITSVVLILLCCSMTGWYLTRVNNKLSKFMNLLIVFSMVVPFQMVMFTLSKTADQLNLNTPWNICIIYLGFGAGLAVFMFTGFMKSVPIEIEEAAMIDGCGPFRILTSIIIPMCKPGIVTVCMISAMAAWNEYLVALVMVTDPTKATLPVGLANLYEIQRYATDWGALFAALVLALIPTVILFIVGQKQLVQGLSVGGVKG
jgi:raffinose/stachyose/melibiose transport system permease protein